MQSTINVHLHEEDGPPTTGVLRHDGGRLSVEVAKGLTLFGRPQQLLEYAETFRRKVFANLDHRPVATPEEAAAGIADCRAALQEAGA